MSPKIRLPASLASFADGQREIPVSGTTVREAIADFTRRYQKLGERLLYPSGELRQFVNVYLNRDDIRDLDDLSTPIADNDIIAIIPAVAGGLE